MSTVQVYDKPMCCSTGVCGPDVDPVLPKFAADLDWLNGRRVNIASYQVREGDVIEIVEWPDPSVHVMDRAAEVIGMRREVQAKAHDREETGASARSGAFDQNAPHLGGPHKNVVRPFEAKRGVLRKVRRGANGLEKRDSRDE